MSTHNPSADRNSRGRGPRFRRPGRKAFVLVLVLFAVIIAMTSAHSFLETQTTSIGIARNTVEHSNARYVAESGVDACLTYVRTTPTWRTDRPNGLWVADAAFAGGTFTISGEDGEYDYGLGIVGSDGDLLDDPSDPLTLTVTGRFSGAAHTTRVVLNQTMAFVPDLNLSAAPTSFSGEAANNASGRSVAGVGDVNGDGYDDFVIGAPSNSDGGWSAGKAYLFLGKPSGWGAVSLALADASFIGEMSAARAGISVAGVGDVNGDHYDDFMIGADTDSTGGWLAGQAYLILGKPSGWAGGTGLSSASASFIGEDLADFAGSRLAGAGDVNGDGYDDILISSIGDFSIPLYSGTVYLILGKPSGWAMRTSLSTANATYVGPYTLQYAGVSLSSAGDVDGDGLDDFLIGSYGNLWTQNRRGETYLVLGQSVSGQGQTVLTNASASFVGEQPNDYAGVSVAAAGDVNGDGLDDFLIGAQAGGSHGYAGEVYLALGKSSGWTSGTSLNTAYASFVGETAGAFAGSGVAGPGDIDGDDRPDLVIGAYADSSNGSSSGQTYVVLGQSGGWSKNTNLSTATGSFIGENSSAYSGYAVSAAGDVNGDGYADFLIGAYGQAASGLNAAGRTYLIFGGSGQTQVVWKEQP